MKRGGIAAAATLLDVSESTDVRVVRAGAERIGELEPLWRALHDHHTAIAPTLAGYQVRPAAESWQRRRARYEVWLSDPDAFVLLAERGSTPVGYALVTLGAGLDGWDAGERVGDVQTLAVRHDARGEGVGSLLLDAVDDRLAALGVVALRLLVVAPNMDAIRFYERRGLVTASQAMLGRIGASQPH